MDVFSICFFLLDMKELLQVPENGDFASAGVVEGDEIISVNGITLRLVLFVLKFLFPFVCVCSFAGFEAFVC